MLKNVRRPKSNVLSQTLRENSFEATRIVMLSEAKHPPESKQTLVLLLQNYPRKQL
jgi:hypothetical protein